MSDTIDTTAGTHPANVCSTGIGTNRTETAHQEAVYPAAAHPATAHPAAAHPATAHPAAGAAGPARTIRTVLRAEGFSCPSCVAKIEKQVTRVAGVTSVRVHFASSRVEVEHDPALASVDDLVKAVARAGYASRPSPF